MINGAREAIILGQKTSLQQTVLRSQIHLLANLRSFKTSSVSCSASVLSFKPYTASISARDNVKHGSFLNTSHGFHRTTKQAIPNSNQRIARNFTTSAPLYKSKKTKKSKTKKNYTELFDSLLIPEAARAAFTALKTNKIRCAFFGSFASRLYGADRMPNDVDILAFPTSPDTTAEDIKELLAKKKEFSRKEPKDKSNDYKILYYRRPKRLCRGMPGKGKKRECKVDIVVPGTMNLPDLTTAKGSVDVKWLSTTGYISGYRPDSEFEEDFRPKKKKGKKRKSAKEIAQEKRMEKNRKRNNLPVVPFPVLLLHKLQGWSDHRVAPEAFKRPKQHQDADDILDLLSLPDVYDLAASYSAPSSKSSSTPTLTIDSSESKPQEESSDHSISPPAINDSPATNDPNSEPIPDSAGSIDSGIPGHSDASSGSSISSSVDNADNVPNASSTPSAVDTTSPPEHPNLDQIWLDTTYFSPSFLELSLKRIRLFSYYFPQSRRTWSDMGFETVPREGEVEEEAEAVRAVKGKVGAPAEVKVEADDDDGCGGWGDDCDWESEWDDEESEWEEEEEEEEWEEEEEEWEEWEEEDFEELEHEDGLEVGENGGKRELAAIKESEAHEGKSD